MKTTINAIGCLLAAVSISAAAAPVYRIEAIPTVGDYTPFQGLSINRQGWAVGSARNPEGSSVCFVYADGIVKLLPDSESATCNDINDNGDVVGNVGDRAYLWPSVGPRRPLTGMISARAINNHGQIVGYTLSGSDWRAVLYADGVLTNLGTLGGRRSMPADINDRGQVVGWSDTGGNASHVHAFIWKAGRKIKDLGTLPGDVNSEAVSINSLGHVVGLSDPGFGSGSQSFIHDDTGMQKLPMTGNNVVRSVNRKDDAVGNDPQFPAGYPTLTHQGTAYKLFDLLDASGKDWGDLWAGSINNAGRIVGNGGYKQEGSRAFIASRVN